MTDQPLTIGEVAHRAGIRASAIRYYESRGVLPVAERVGGQRRYGDDAVERLGFVDVAQRAGFSLDEIRDLLDDSEKGEVSPRLQSLARRKLPEVERLIVRATAMKEWLEVATECGCSTLDDCGLFQQTEAGRANGSRGAELTVIRRPGREEAA
jgi:MerR family transcriptional regulator, redox-sensitive transcriptional activator SoxR